MGRQCLKTKYPHEKMMKLKLCHVLNKCIWYTFTIISIFTCTYILISKSQNTSKTNNKIKDKKQNNVFGTRFYQKSMSSRPVWATEETLFCTESKSTETYPYDVHMTNSYTKQFPASLITTNLQIKTTAMPILISVKIKINSK